MYRRAWMQVSIHFCELTIAVGKPQPAVEFVDVLLLGWSSGKAIHGKEL